MARALVQPDARAELRQAWVARRFIMILSGAMQSLVPCGQRRGQDGIKLRRRSKCNPMPLLYPPFL